MAGAVSQSDISSPSASPQARSRKGSEETARFEDQMTAVLTIDVKKPEGDDGSKQPSKGEAASDNLMAETSSETASVEIEIKTFEGGDLVDQLSVTSRRGTADLTLSADGAVGVATDGFFYTDNPNVQMGETLTFTVPSDLGEVHGGAITFSNLLNSDKKAERALVIANDARGYEVLRCLVSGDASGQVTLDIDVSFASLDVKPVDNGSWTLSGNSDFTIERIDVKTGVAADQDDGHQHQGGFLSDLFGLFAFKDFSVRDAIERFDRNSISTFFPDTQNDEKPEDRQDDRVYRTLDEQERKDRA